MAGRYDSDPFDEYEVNPFSVCELSLRLFFFCPGPNLLVKVYAPYVVK
jgi:hypothetical protein